MVMDIIGKEAYRFSGRYEITLTEDQVSFFDTHSWKYFSMERKAFDLMIEKLSEKSDKGGSK